MAHHSSHYSPQFDTGMSLAPSGYLLNGSPSVASPAMSDRSQFSSSSSSTSSSPYGSPLYMQTELHPVSTPSTSRSLPSTPSRSRRRGRRSDSHIRRPRNAFIIFRSEMCKQKKISAGVEKDHRRISQIIAAYWNSLSDAEKQPWADKAAEEKEAHRRKHPDYRFSPVNRASPVKRRKTKRNGPQEKERDKRLGAALAAGLDGSKLQEVIQQIDASLPLATPGQSAVEQNVADISSNARSHIFRSPLIPPGNLASPFGSPGHNKPKRLRSSSLSATYAATSSSTVAPSREGNPALIGTLRTRSLPNLGRDLATIFRPYLHGAIWHGEPVSRTGAAISSSTSSSGSALGLTLQNEFDTPHQTDYAAQLFNELSLGAAVPGSSYDTTASTSVALTSWANTLSNDQGTILQPATQQQGVYSNLTEIPADRAWVVDNAVSHPMIQDLHLTAAPAQPSSEIHMSGTYQFF